MVLQLRDLYDWRPRQSFSVESVRRLFDGLSTRATAGLLRCAIIMRMPKRLIIALGIGLACCRCAIALNPSLDVNQYAHTAWTTRDGIFKGAIDSFAQTPDGYLWLATEFGLFRFDGVRSVPWQPPAGEHLPSNSIRRLLVARDGRLWIGTDKGLTSWKNGKLTHYRELTGQDILAVLEDREGTVWIGAFATSTGRLCAVRTGGIQCYGEDGSLGRGILTLCEDGQGNLWAGGANGLWRWKPGPPKRYPKRDQDGEIYALVEGDNSALLIATAGGITKFADGKAEAFPLPGVALPITAHRLLRDRNGGLWIGTGDRGILHLHQGRTDVFTQSDGLSGNNVARLFEDREGNIWAATLDGLDRFRDLAVPTISVKQGLSSANVWSVLAARDGSVWLGTPKGLNRLNDGQITVYRKETSGLPDSVVQSLFQDARGRIWASSLGGGAYFENGRFVPVKGLPGGQMHSIAGDSAGNLWISDQDRGLLHLLEGRVVETIPWARLGRQDIASTLLSDPAQGGLWVGFFGGGVAYFKDGQVRASFGVADGLGEGHVNDLQLDPDGALWAATQGGLSRVKNGRVTTLASRNGLPCDAVNWMLEDDSHALWLGMACGLVRIAKSDLDAWLANAKRMIPVTVFDESDGFRSHANTSSYSPRAAKTANGKLWFLPFGGVSVVDPHHLPFNKLPPPVHIEQIVADRQTYDTASNLRLPPLVRDLEIDYTALSLAAPEKIRFRVKLEGRDPGWKDVGNERKAFYNDLPPRQYRFRVMASNNNGVWNEAGASFNFSIEPAYYQTSWFLGFCAIAFLSLLWGMYRYRLHQIARQFDMRLEERVGERTRIARELHDTLLQSFQALMFHFQAVKDQLPPGKAQEALERVLDRADRAIAEGREAIQNLRSSTQAGNELSQAMAALGEELAGAKNGENVSAAFRISIEGPPRDLHPIVRDDIYRIAREALQNAFRHAQASQVEAEITYGEALLRLRIRDDGKGIDPEHLHAGRDGHWGLAGMRERAEQIGAKLEIWSEIGAGTEVELRIPGSKAYETARRRTGLRLFGTKGGRLS